MTTKREYFTPEPCLPLTRGSLVKRIAKHGPRSPAYVAKCHNTSCYKAFQVTCERLLTYINLHRGPLPTSKKWQPQPFCDKCYRANSKWRRSMEKQGLKNADILELERSGVVKLPSLPPRVRDLILNRSPVQKECIANWIQFDHRMPGDPPDIVPDRDQGYCMEFNELALFVYSPDVKVHKVPKTFEDFIDTFPCPCCDANHRAYSTKNIIMDTLQIVVRERGTTYDVVRDILLNEAETAYEVKRGINRRKYSNGEWPTLFDRELTGEMDLTAYKGRMRKEDKNTDGNGNRVYSRSNSSGGSTGSAGSNGTV